MTSEAARGRRGRRLRLRGLAKSQFIEWDEDSDEDEEEDRGSAAAAPTPAAAATAATSSACSSPLFNSRGPIQ